MRTRKTDKWRLKEGRGLGMGEKYKPWFKVHEFGSKGRVTRRKGWKAQRPYQAMSDTEDRFLLNMQYDDDVLDIREQYPLLPLEQTQMIADKLGFIHPPKSRKEKTVMTTDFLLTLKEDPLKYKAVAIKQKKDLEDERTVEKLAIEAEYWRLKSIDFEIITEEDIDVVKAKNLEIMYQDFWWQEKMQYLPTTIDVLVKRFKDLMANKEVSAVEAAKQIEKEEGWQTYEYVNFLHYLIVTKRILVNLSIPLDLETLEVVF